MIEFWIWAQKVFCGDCLQHWLACSGSLEKCRDAAKLRPASFTPIKWPPEREIVRLLKNI